MIRRRFFLWVLRTGLAAALTGLVIATLVALPFAIAPMAPLTLLPLAWALGCGWGGAAGIIAGLLGATLATVLSPRHVLSARPAAVLGAVVCALGSGLVMLVLYGFEPDPHELYFFVPVTVVAAIVGAAISPHSERRAGLDDARRSGVTGR